MSINIHNLSNLSQNDPFFNGRPSMSHSRPSMSLPRTVTNHFIDAIEFATGDSNIASNMRNDLDLYDNQGNEVRCFCPFIFI